MLRTATLDFVLLLLGVAFAAVGGRAFVSGSIQLATSLRVPPGIVGATVAAFATSSPELGVGVNAALAGTPQVSVGNALGSNVVNLALVMGIILLWGPVRLDPRDVRRDLPFTIAAPLILAVLLWDGALSRMDGVALLLVFLAWMGTTVLQVARERDTAAAVIGQPGRHRAVLLTVVGVALLLVAGRLVVLAADGIGRRLGLDPFIVGATLVSLGTCVPELATAILARHRRRDDLGAGTVMGSNTFNTLFIVAVVTIIQPFRLSLDEVAIAALTGSVMALLLIPRHGWALGRIRGGLLIGGYFLYVAALVSTQTGR